MGSRTPHIGHRTSDGEKSKNNISTPQGGGHKKLDLAHRKTDANCIHRKDNAPKPLGPIISKL